MVDARLPGVAKRWGNFAAISGFRPQLDERVGLRIRPGHIFLFDTKSEKRLRF